MKEASEAKGEYQVYELGYLVLPSVTEDKLPSVVEKLQKAIKAAKGEELDSEPPEEIDLAYTMTKTVGASRYVVNDAYIGWIKFEGEPATAPTVKGAVDGMEEILRYLLIKAPRKTSFTFAKARALLAEKAPKESDTETPAPVAEEVLVQ